MATTRRTGNHSVRVHLTALFMDRFGSTLDWDTDPDGARKRTRKFVTQAKRMAEKYPQVVSVKQVGDECVFCFQSPVDALRCALRFRDYFAKNQLHVHIAVESLTGEIRGDEVSAHGMNKCARLCSAAPAGVVWVGEIVAKAVGAETGEFVFLPMKPIKAKGFRHPVPVHEVRKRGEAQPPDPFAEERSAYLRRLAEHYEWIDLGGLAPQVGTELLRIGLDDIFVHLTAEREARELEKFRREEIRLREEMEEAELEPAERERRLRALAERTDERYRQEERQQKERVQVDALAEKRCNVVLGDPGSGKTTLLRYLARRLALRKALDGTEAELSGPWADLLPVYLRLGEYAPHCQTSALKDYLPKAAAGHGIPLPPDLLEFEMERGRCLFLLDGLDEIAEASARRRVSDCVRDFAEAHRANRFVVTSRLVGYREAPLPSGEGGFAHFTLCPFDDEDVARFVERWYEAIGRTGDITDPARQNAEVLTKAIRSNESVRKLATNPLLLTLIALMYWREVKPRRRIELYRSASETLLDKWRSVGLNLRESTTLLMAVAFRMHQTSGAGLIARPELEKPLIDLKTNPTRGGRSQMDAERETEQFLSLLSQRSGLLYPKGLDDRGHEVFGFLHLTFEEYFAARELARLWKQHRLKVKDYLHLPRWREVLMLASAHLSDEDDEQASDRFVGDILEAGSPYEHLLHRDLLLAAHCLADDAVVYPKTAEKVLKKLDAAFSTSVQPLNETLAKALGAMAGSRFEAQVLSLAMQGLKHGSPQRRYAAARTIGALGERAATPEFLTGLAGLLRDEDSDVRYAAARTIGALGVPAATPEVLAQLEGMLRDGEWRVRSAAAEAFGALGERAATPEVLAQLKGLLRDGEWRVRATAAQAIGALGHPAAKPEVLSELARLLSDRHAPVRATAAQAIGALGVWAAPPEFLSALAVLLCRGNWQERFAAVQAIGALGERAATSEFVAKVEGLLRKRHHATRSTAAWALGAMGKLSAAPQSLAELERFLWDPNWEVRHAATYALAASGALDERAVTSGFLARLTRRLRSSDWQKRQAAAQVLGAMGEWAATPEVVKGLAGLLRHGEWRVQQAAAQALGAIGERAARPEVVKGLAGLLRHGEWRVRSAAAATIGGMGKRYASPEVVKGLAGLLGDDDSHVRSAAARAIAALGERAATPEVLEAFAAAVGDPKNVGTQADDAAWQALSTLCAYYRPGEAGE